MPAGIHAVANIFEVSAGPVIKCIKHFIRAVNKLADRYIVWSSESRRTELAFFAWEKFGFRGCIGSVDGSQVPLAYAPRVQPWTFWDRDDRCIIHVLVFSDRNRSIIPVTFGFSSSASDEMVKEQVECVRFPGENVSLGELFSGDKGMYSTNRVVGPHIGQSGPTASNKNLDWQLAPLRVISKHNFGIVTGRRAGLKEIRVPLALRMTFWQP